LPDFGIVSDEIITKDHIMLRILTASSILALAAVPALAQQADPVATGNEMPTAEAPADTVTAPADPMSETTDANAKTPTRAEQAQSLVEAEFATYDADANGELSQAEFSAWVMTLAKSDKPAADPAKEQAAKEKWAVGAFAAADTDKSKRVSKAEMSSFLQG
jgi:hypothetical protein